MVGGFDTFYFSCNSSAVCGYLRREKLEEKLFRSFSSSCFLRGHCSPYSVGSSHGMNGSYFHQLSWSCEFVIQVPEQGHLAQKINLPWSLQVYLLWHHCCVSFVFRTTILIGWFWEVRAEISLYKSSFFIFKNMSRRNVISNRNFLER